MRSEALPCTSGDLDSHGLAALNQSPLVFLANCGVRHGAWFGASFLRAQSLIDRHGTSRRIERDDARKLCAAMRDWADKPARGRNQRGPR